MPHTHGYAPVGERCHSVKDWYARNRTDAIGLLIKGALLTVGLFTVHINADIFLAWVMQDLLSKLLFACLIVSKHSAQPSKPR